MKHGPFEDVFPIENGGIPCYVSLPECICFFREGILLFKQSLRGGFQFEVSLYAFTVWADSESAERLG